MKITGAVFALIIALPVFIPGAVAAASIPRSNIPAALKTFTGLDGTVWEQVTKPGFGFGDSRLVSFEAFAPFNGMPYVSGSKAANSVPGGIAGAKIFRQRRPHEQPDKQKIQK